MEKRLYIFAILFCVYGCFMTNAQNYNAIIHLKNGQPININTELIDSITFEKIGSHKEDESGMDFVSFSLLTTEGKLCNSFLIDDGTVHVKIPNNTNFSHLTPIFAHNGKFVTRGGNVQESGLSAIDVTDFTVPIEYYVNSETGEQKKWEIKVYNLPVCVINTPDGKPIVSKVERKEGCEIRVIDDEDEVDLGTAGIKGRGNSSQ